MAYGGPQARGTIGAVAASLHHSHSWATSSTYTTAHGNARSLIHWVRPGIKPASSWRLIEFVNHGATMGTPTNCIYNTNYHHFRHLDTLSKGLCNANNHSQVHIWDVRFPGSRSCRQAAILKPGTDGKVPVGVNLASLVGVLAFICSLGLPKSYQDVGPSYL